MTKTIVNLWAAVVTKEVEAVLTDYADHPYQQAFAIPDLRQELIAYVLTRAPGNYATVEEACDPSSDSCTLLVSAADRLLLRAWIHDGIQHIFDRYSETITKHIPELDDPGLAPSHWFG